MEPEPRRELNRRQRRRKAQHELHAMKLLTARLLGADPENLRAVSNVKSRVNIRLLELIILGMNRNKS